jgi:hypothetical protein
VRKSGRENPKRHAEISAAEVRNKSRRSSDSILLFIRAISSGDIPTFFFGLSEFTS